MKVRFLVTTTFAAVLWCLLATTSVQAADDLDPNLDGGSRFVTVGQLATMQVGQTKRLRYVLLDSEGEVISRLRSVDGLDLSQFEGQEVGVTARTLVDGDVPILLAERVSTFGQAVEPSMRDRVATSNGQVALAAFQEGVLPGPSTLPIEGPIVTEGGPVVYEGGPMQYGGPIVTENYVGGGSACGGNCGNANCSSCVACPCGPPGRFFLRAEYLGWATKGMHTPALVTASPNDAGRNEAGVLGETGTTVVFGNSDLFEDARSGLRFRLGTWCDACQWIGFELEYLYLGDESEGYQNCDIGRPILARPFFNTGLNEQDAELVQYPGAVVGKVTVDADTSFWAISPRMRVNLACEQLCDPGGIGGSYRFDLLVGYRYLRLDDSLRIHESLTTIDARNGAAPPSNSELFWDPASQSYIDVQDSFSASNDFNGADLGMLWEGYRGPWSLELIGRIGIGNTRQEVSIDGVTRASDIDVAVTDPGGFLALSSNIGTRRQDKFSVVPEFGATLGYALSPRSKFVVGYTFLYWNKVVRAGEHIDTRVNTDLVPPPIDTDDPIAPRFAFNDGDFWAQGLSLGLDCRW